ncbi:meiotic recombination protein SPO11-like isoform X3 [Littorina saxatilis]|uniref:meiotic recombination protein SPO11-like isoform X3 n=1 Tax=Littorina saxatilis TaxID=31220 RepID=UPI0038B618CA
MASFTSDVSQSLADKLREEILNKIEAVYASVTNAVINGAVPEFSFYSRASWECLSFSEETGVTLSADEKKMVRVRLDNKQSVKSFAYMTKVLNIMYKLVQEDKYCTKRDIYYQSPDVFGSQSVVDNVVDNVACMLEVPRWKLHVGVQIPAHDKDMLYLHTNAQLVIVVEKDATFQKLLTEDFCATFGRVILITGKGYPDVGTRLLVRKIWEQFKMPVFALVDGDPHGIEVMLVYKYGSKNQAFENHNLAVPAMKWLGVLATDIAKLSLRKTALLDLSESDLQKLTDMLKRPYVAPNSPLAHQLETMVQSGVKAELQCLDSLSSSYLTQVYLPAKIHGGDWI